MALRSYQVVVADAFADDLEQALIYYERQSGPQSAECFLGKYDSFIELVSRIPGHGSLIGDSGLRWRQLDVFIAVYEEDEIEHVVTVLRLYYLSTNWRHRILGD